MIQEFVERFEKNKDKVREMLASHKRHYDWGERRRLSRHPRLRDTRRVLSTERLLVRARGIRILLRLRHLTEHHRLLG